MWTYREIQAQSHWPRRMGERELNYPERERRCARDLVFWVELDADDKVGAIGAVIASAKLGAVRFSA